MKRYMYLDKAAKHYVGCYDSIETARKAFFRSNHSKYKDTFERRSKLNIGLGQNGRKYYCFTIAKRDLEDSPSYSDYTPRKREIIEGLPLSSRENYYPVYTRDERELLSYFEKTRAFDNIGPLEDRTLTIKRFNGSGRQTIGEYYGKDFTRAKKETLDTFLDTPPEERPYTAIVMYESLWHETEHPREEDIVDIQIIDRALYYWRGEVEEPALTFYCVEHGSGASFSYESYLSRMEAERRASDIWNAWSLNDRFDSELSIYVGFLDKGDLEELRRENLTATDTEIIKTASFSHLGFPLTRYRMYE